MREPGGSAPLAYVGLPRPDIVESILNGHQPSDLNLCKIDSRLADELSRATKAARIPIGAFTAIDQGQLVHETPSLFSGWPWVDEMTAVALHKGNVFWEVSGWAPKYFPPQLRVDIRGRLEDKIMFCSDYPSISYARLLREWDELGYADDIMEQVFRGNAERVLALPG